MPLRNAHAWAVLAILHIGDLRSTDDCRPSILHTNWVMPAVGQLPFPGAATIALFSTRKDARAEVKRHLSVTGKQLFPFKTRIVRVEVVPV